MEINFGRRAGGRCRLLQLQDLAPTTRVSTELQESLGSTLYTKPQQEDSYKNKKPKATFSKDKSSIRLQQFHQTTRLPTDYTTFNRLQLIHWFIDSLIHWIMYHTRTIHESCLMYHTWITPDVPYLYIYIYIFIYSYCCHAGCLPCGRRVNKSKEKRSLITRCSHHLWVQAVCGLRAQSVLDCY